jgi:hypothetical protein
MAQILSVPGHPDPVGFEVIDEGLHESAPDPLWQESTWVYWGDGAGAGGVVHVSQEPINARGSVFAAAYAGGSAYRRLTGFVDLASSVRAVGGHGVGGYSIHHEGGSSAVRAVDDELEIDLVFKDQLPYPSLLAAFPAIGDPAKIVTSTSYQTPGSVTGTVRLGEQVHTIEAMAQRGHSWGIRDYPVLLGHGSRFVTGGLAGGPSFFAYAVVLPNGMVMRTGYVIDAGRVSYARNITIGVEFDLDGESAIGGRVEMDCESGQYVFRCDLENLNQFWMHDVNFSVCFGPATLDGRSDRGWCAWEIQNGVPDVDPAKPFFLRGYTVDGLQR